MKRKIKSVGLIVLSALLSVSLLCGIGLMLERQITTYAAVVEDDVICKATIDDNFEDNKILVTLKPEFSKFNKLSSNIEKMMFKLGVIQIDNLTEFPASYVRADGMLNPKTAPSLTEYYKTTPFKQILAITLNKADKQNVLDTIKQIEMLDEVFCAYPNMIEEVEYVPSDDLYSNQWSLNNTQGIHAEDAWDVTRGSYKVRVGVIDSGIASHSDLNANVVQGKDFYNNDFITSDDEDGHGTSVAGIIGAISDSQGISGIAPKTTIVPLQTSYYNKTEKAYLHTSEARAEAIQYAINLWENSTTRISVLNHSISGFGTNSYLLSYISNYPGLFVWSAGNNGNNLDDVYNFPNINRFNLDNLISVGAIDKYNERSVWNSSQSSNYGSTVNIFAPGGKEFNDSENILTTNNSDGYRYFNGTSAAAPHVTGVAALMLSVNPDLTGAELKEKILSSADDITISTPGGPQNVKKLNAYKAVMRALNYEVVEITFDQNGGSEGTTEVYAAYGELLPLVDLPKRVGYNFLGYFSDDGTLYYEFYDPNFYEEDYYYYGYFAKYCDFDHDITLHAEWESMTWNVSVWGYLSNHGPIAMSEHSFTLSRDQIKVFALPGIEDYDIESWTLTYMAGTIASGTEHILYMKNWCVGNYSDYTLTIKYHYNPQDNCIAEGTLITLADGSQKAVEELTGDEMLLVWNLFTGTFDYAPILFIDSEPIGHYEVIKLSFSDGTTVDVISEHGFWDVDLNKYVYLDEYAAEYIGHSFLKQGENGMTEVTLLNVDITTEVTTAYSPVTYGHLCYYVNGMLSMPGGIDGLFNIFEVDSETMMYDAEAMAADIEEYGLFTYEELNSLVPVLEELFEAVNGQYLKVAVGKGIITIEQIQGLVDRYSHFFE